MAIFTLPAPPPLANETQAGLIGIGVQSFSGQKTFQGLLVTNSGVQFGDGSVQTSAYPFVADVFNRGSSAPVAGTWSVGDLFFNSEPSPGEPGAWVCTTAGSPGTWMPFGGVSNPGNEDVKFYGAVGNGTADDTAAIQAAVDAAAPSGGTVFFPAGVYKVTAQITVPQNVNLVGSGRQVNSSNAGTVIYHVPAVATTDCLYFARDPHNNYTENHVRDLTVLGTVNSRDGVIADIGWMRMSNVSIKNFPGKGLYLLGMINSVFESVVITACDYGVYFDPDAMVSTSVSFRSCYLSNNRIGALVQNCNSTAFNDWCIFESNTQDALVAESSVALTDPYFEDNTRCLIKVGVSTEVEYVVVRGGLFVGGGLNDDTYDAIYLDQCKFAEFSIHDMRLPKACHLRTTSNTGSVYWHGADHIQALSAPLRGNNTPYNKGDIITAVCTDGVTRTFIVKVAGTTAGAQPGGYTRTATAITDGGATIGSYGEVIPYDWSRTIMVQQRDDRARIIGRLESQYEDVSWGMLASFTYQIGDFTLGRQGGAYPIIYSRPSDDKVGFQGTTVSTTQGARFNQGLEVAGSLSFSTGGSLTFGSAAPNAGTHAAGEIVFNNAPVAGSAIGWVCVAGGTPGTWKEWGIISL